MPRFNVDEPDGVVDQKRQHNPASLSAVTHSRFHHEVGGKMFRVSTLRVASGILAIAGALTAGFVVASPAHATGNLTVAEGIVTDSSGHAAAYEPMILIAEPTAAQFDAVPDGDSISEAIVGSATADASGNYSLSIDDTDAVDAAATADGAVDFYVATLDASSTGVGDVILAHWDATADDVSQYTGSDEQGASTPVTLNNSGGTVHIKPGPIQNVVVAPATCMASAVKTIGDETVTIGRYYSRATGVSAREHFSDSSTAGATASLGVAESTSSGGTFKASGTSQVESSTGIDEATPFKTGSFNNAANAKFKYRQFSHTCVNRGTTASHWYEDRPTKYEAGLVNVNLSSAATFPSGTSYCIPKQKGSTFSISSSTASTFSTGVDISAVIGIDLSSQAGYTKNVKLEMNFPTAAGQICGQKGKPADSPGLLIARNS